MQFDLFFLQLFNGSSSCFLDGLALTLTSGFTWIPLYLCLFLLVIRNNNYMSQILLTVGCVVLCLLLSGILSDLFVKPYVMRLRPCYDPSVSDLVTIHKQLHVTGYSFFSSHAANTATVATFFILLTRSVKMLVGMSIWSLFISWTRVYLGVHWMSDVLFGIVWGVCVALILYFIYLRLKTAFDSNKQFVSSHYTQSGYKKADINVLLCVIILTFIYGVIKTLASYYI